MASHTYQTLAQGEGEAEVDNRAPHEIVTAEAEVEPVNEPTTPGFVLDAPPPKYAEATPTEPVVAESAKLPTYEEYEKEHEHEEEFDTNLPEEYTMAENGGSRRGIAVVQVIPYAGLDLKLGDDLTFCAMFFLSFFLNWVGFLIAYCFSRTISGKCGATSGFGLGLIKLAFLLRNNPIPDSTSHDGYANWFVWLMVLFGWFTFVRGITLYLRYKREFAASQREVSVV